MKYFAYGSNCDPAVMERKRVAYVSARYALLPGYRMRFNKRSLRASVPAGVGFANIEEDATSTVEGVLYEIPDDQLEGLDASERYPEHYRRIEVVVRTEEGEESCFCYQAQPDKVDPDLKPSRNYLNHILAAKDYFSSKYFESLNSQPAYQGPCVCCEEQSEVIFVREKERLHMLCQACREAQRIWGDTCGRKLTVSETQAIMTELVKPGDGFSSIRELIERAASRGIIEL